MAHEGLQLAKKLMQTFTTGKGFNRLMKKVDLLSVGDGKCKAELLLGPEHQNSFGSLHGGMTAALVDVVTTVAMMSGNKGKVGVSVDINVQYINAAKEGDVIVLDARTMTAELEKQLVFLEIYVTNKTNGNLIAKGKHTMFIF